MLYANKKCNNLIDHFVKIKMTAEFHHFNLEIQLQNISSCTAMLVYYITLIYAVYAQFLNENNLAGFPY